jgi:hypothetical protein
MLSSECDVHCDQAMKTFAIEAQMFHCLSCCNDRDDIMEDFMMENLREFYAT